MSHEKYGFSVLVVEVLDEDCLQFHLSFNYYHTQYLIFILSYSLRPVKPSDQNKLRHTQFLVS